MNRQAIYAEIDAERNRQEAKWGGRHAWGHGSCASPDLAPIVKVAVLAEECGEVARAVLDNGPKLEGSAARRIVRAELVQVAAVAVAWLESLDAARKERG